MKKPKLISFLLLTFPLILLSQDQTSIALGSQIWQKMNINKTSFRNGDLIQQAKSNEEWSKAIKNAQPAWCYYKNDSTTEETYGKLYNFYAIIDPRGLAPSGWHIPDAYEWQIALDELEKLRQGNSQKHKETFDFFTGASRDFIGNFPNCTEEFVFWSSSADAEDFDLIIYAFIDKKMKKINLLKGNIGNGYSLRCIKDYKVK